jgi:hypothetical protein
VFPLPAAENTVSTSKIHPADSEKERKIRLLVAMDAVGRQRNLEHRIGPWQRIGSGNQELEP